MRDEAVERPSDFDLEAYWTASSQRFVRERRRYRATLRIEPNAALWILTYQNATVVAGAAPGDRADWLTVVVHFEAEDEATFVACGLGSRVDVIEPEVCVFAWGRKPRGWSSV